MPFDVQAAKAAGYTDEEINAYLADQSPEVKAGRAPLRVTIGGKGFDVEGAKAAGYTDEEIESYLSGRPGMTPPPVETVDVPASEAPQEAGLGGLLASAMRGAAPVAGGAALGAAIGAPLGGVGAIPGALAGAAAGGLATMVGDPLVEGANALFGTEIPTPTQGLDAALTALGLPQSVTPEQRVAEYTARGAGTAATGIAGGQLLAQGARMAPTVAQGVGQTLASQPALQLGGAMTGASAGQTAREMGAGPGTSTMLELAAGMAPGAMVSGGRGAADFFSGDRSALKALEDAGISPEAFRQTYANLAQQLGRLPSMAEAAGQAITARLRPFLADAPENPERVSSAVETSLRQQRANVEARVTSGARNADALVDNAKRRGDIEFERYRNSEVPLSIPEIEYMKNLAEDMPEVFQRMPRPEQRALLAKINSQDLSPITGNEMDKLRQAIRETAVREGSAAYKAEAENVENLLTKYIPEARRAVANYARRMSRAEGAAIGESGVRKGSAQFSQEVRRPELQRPSNLSAAEQALFDALPAKDRGRLARMGGARAGFKAELVNVVKNKGSAAYDLADKIGDGTTNLADNVRLVFSPQEAQSFIQSLQAQKQAFDSLSGITGIPPQKVATMTDDTKGLTDLAIIAFGPSGGAMQSNFVTRFLDKRMKIGERSSRALADKLLDPKQVEPTLKMLEKRGVQREEVAAVMRGALFSAAMTPPPDQPQE